MAEKFKSLLHRYKRFNAAVRASFWFTICSIFQKGISVVTLPVFTRLMDTAQYGKYSIFQTWYSIFFIIITLNIQSEIFNKGLIVHSGNKDEYSANQAGLLVFLAGAFTVVYVIFRDSINRRIGFSTYLMIVMIIEILSNAIFGLWSARMRFDFKYREIVCVTLAASVLNPLIGIFAVYLSEEKAEARILSNAIVPAILAVCLIIGFARKDRLFGKFHWWKAAVMGSLPLLPHYLSLVLLNQSDKLMIQYFVGVEEAGIYSVAHSAGLLMTIINTSINGSFVPWAYDKMKNHNGDGIKRISGALFAIVMAVNLALIWFAPEAIKLLAAPAYYDAIWCLVPIAGSVYFFFVYTLFADIEIYFGENHFVAIASVCATGMNLVLNYIFIPRYGYFAAGYTTWISYFMTMVLHYIFMKKSVKKHGFHKELFDVKIIAILGACMVLFSAIAGMLYSQSLIRIGIACAAVIILAGNRKKLAAAILEIGEK